MKDEVIRKTTNLVARTLEELSVECYVFGVRVREQLKKFLVASGGPWGAVAFLFKDEGKEPKLMLASFRTDGTMFKRYSYFIIRSKEEASKVIEILKECFNL